MNVVVSLFAQDQEEKRVIRFKKVPANDTSSKSPLFPSIFDLE